MRVARTLLAALVVAWMSTSVCGATAVIDFKINSKARRGLKKAPTFVVWIETETGEYVTTLRMGKSAKWQKSNPTKPVFATWRQTPMASAHEDAITMATPGTAKRKKVSAERVEWDLKDSQGGSVGKGDYVLMIETVPVRGKKENFPQMTKLPFSVGGRRKKFSKARTVLSDGSKAKSSACYLQKITLAIKK